MAIENYYKKSKNFDIDTLGQLFAKEIKIKILYF